MDMRNICIHGIKGLVSLVLIFGTSLSAAVLSTGCRKEKPATELSVGAESDEREENVIEGGDTVYPALSEVYDVDGNRYGVVEIGDLLWMSENLKTTRLCDGTPLDLVEDADSWARSGGMESGDPRVCHYVYDGSDASGKGMFYSWSAVKTGKICPEGWRVPSREEWLAMRDFAGGELQAGVHLKTTGGWLNAAGESRPEWQGDDIFGFHAIPSGYVDEKGAFDHTGLGYGSESVAYYWSSSESTEIRPYYFTIYYMAPNLKEETSTVVSYGMSVRCVRDK